jgi:hypothetical protein
MSGSIDILSHKLYYRYMTLNTAIYKVESGAAKKRKKLKEQEDWNSKNGPVITRKIDNGRSNTNTK